MHSSPKHARIRRHAGFTLIELLTVIAIIGILAAIIIPTVSKVRSTAKKAQCVARLRQWGTVVNTCANDYKNTIPLFFKADPSFSYDPYITSGRKMIVESEKDGLTRNLLPYEAFTICPTGINGGSTVGSTRQYNFIVPIGVTSKPGTIFGTSNEVNFYRVSEASAPAQLLLMIEMNNNNPLKPSSLSDIKTQIKNGNVLKIQTDAGFVRHNGTINALFLDGHVGSLSLADTDYDNADSRPKLERWFTLR